MAYYCPLLMASLSSAESEGDGLLQQYVATGRDLPTNPVCDVAIDGYFGDERCFE